MNCFAEASTKERALIPNVMQPSPRNSIKITEIDQKRVIHALIIKNEDEYQSSSREEPPYTMYCVPKTRQYIMLLKLNISLLYIGGKGVQ